MDDEAAKTQFAWWALVLAAVACLVLGALTVVGILGEPKILGVVLIFAGIIGGSSLPGLRQYLK